MGDRRFYTRWSDSASVPALAQHRARRQPRTTERTPDGQRSNPERHARIRRTVRRRRDRGARHERLRRTPPGWTGGPPARRAATSGTTILSTPFIVVTYPVVMPHGSSPQKLSAMSGGRQLPTPIPRPSGMPLAGEPDRVPKPHAGHQVAGSPTDGKSPATCHPRQATDRALGCCEPPTAATPALSPRPRAPAVSPQPPSSANPDNGPAAQCHHSVRPVPRALRSSHCVARPSIAFVYGQPSTRPLYNDLHDSCRTRPDCLRQ